MHVVVHRTSQSDSCVGTTGASVFSIHCNSHEDPMDQGTKSNAAACSVLNCSAET